MTQDQIMGLIRQLLPIVGTLLVTFKLMSPESLAGFTDKALLVIGGLMPVISLVWAYFANNKSSILKSAAQMPEVKEIKLDPTKPETTTLNDVTPNNVTIAPRP